DKAQMLAVERKVLQAGVGAVGDDERHLAAGTVVEPDAVRRLHFPGLLARPTPSPHPADRPVVLVDVMRTVTVSDVENAVRSKGHVGRAELAHFLIDSCLERVADPPELFARKRCLDHLAVANVAQVEEFLAVLLADVDTVSAGVIFLPERADELARRIEDGD